MLYAVAKETERLLLSMLEVSWQFLFNYQEGN